MSFSKPWNPKVSVSFAPASFHLCPGSCADSRLEGPRDREIATFELAQRRLPALIAMVSATMGSAGAGDAPTKTGNGNRFLLDKKPLPATIRASGEALKTLQSQRDNLRNKIQSLWHRLGSVEKEYWAQGQQAVQQFVAVRGDGDRHFDQWRGEYAKQRLLDVRKTMEDQRVIRTRIREYEEELDRLDASFWSSVQYTLVQMATATLQVPQSPPKPQVGKRLRRRKQQTRTVGAKQRSASSLSAAATSRPSTRHRRNPALPASSTRTDPVPKQRRKTNPVKAITRPDPSSFQGVMNAVPGQFYQAYYPSHRGDEGWYMGYTLPWNGDQWEKDIALQFSMRQIDLKTDWPECYVPELTEIRREDECGTIVTDTMVTGIQAWAPGFEDGGPLVKERVFLFLYFDDTPRTSVKLRIPKRAGTKIKFTKAEIASGKLPIDWVPAAYLRPVDVDVGSPVRGRQLMKSFEKMLRELRRSNLSNNPARSSTRTYEDVGDSRLSWDDTKFSFKEPSSAYSQVDGCQDTTLKISGVQDSQAEVSSSPGLSHQIHVDEHDEDDFSKTSMHSPSMRRLSSVRGDDSLSDEGVIMDYDLEVDKIAPPQGSRKDAASHPQQQQERDQASFSEGRESCPRGSSFPPQTFPLHLSWVPRAQSLPCNNTTATKVEGLSKLDSS